MVSTFGILYGVGEEAPSEEGTGEEASGEEATADEEAGTEEEEEPAPEEDPGFIAAMYTCSVWVIKLLD